jgi:hypothetical protein
MNTLAAMVTLVRAKLLAVGEDIRQSGYINAGRNYFIQTAKGSFVLKWNAEEFRAAGNMIPELGSSGPGMTLSLQVFEQMKEHKPVILFALSGSDKIYAITYDELARLGEKYLQFGGEWVQVVLTKSLSDWENP